MTKVNDNAVSLRNFASLPPLANAGMGTVLREAADEIERLRELLAEAADDLENANYGLVYHKDTVDRIRAALPDQQADST